MSNLNTRRLLELTKLPGNGKCADCNSPNPEWSSYTLGLFICECCAGIHRSLGTDISRIKSLTLDNWESDQVQFMKAEGNVRAKTKYECQVPLCYKRPTRCDPLILREEWIKAKYQRREFVDGAGMHYLCGNIEAHLMKRGKGDKKFNKRKFVLDETKNELKYFIKEDTTKAKAVLHVDELNCIVVPDKVGHPFGMQITFEQDGGTRNLFVYFESGEELVHWFTAIRSAKLNRLRVAYPVAQDRELCQNLTRDFIREGWLYKTGPSKGDVFRRRWCSLDKRKLMYYEDPLDAFPKGEIFIGPEDKGFKATEGMANDPRDTGCCFTLKTPHRNFHFKADNTEEQRCWIDVLRRVIRTPLAPQETSSMLKSIKK